MMFDNDPRFRTVMSVVADVSLTATDSIFVTDMKETTGKVHISGENIIQNNKLRIS